MQAYGTHRLEHTYMFTLFGAETPNYIQKNVLSSETVVQQEQKTCLPCFHGLEYKYCAGTGSCLLHVPGGESLRAAGCSFTTSCISRAVLASKQFCPPLMVPSHIGPPTWALSPSITWRCFPLGWPFQALEVNFLFRGESDYDIVTLQTVFLSKPGMVVHIWRCGRWIIGWVSTWGIDWDPDSKYKSIACKDLPI